MILEGHAAVLAGDNEFDAPAVSLVIVPANVPHDLRNARRRQSRHVWDGAMTVGPLKTTEVRNHYQIVGGKSRNHL